MNVDDDPVDRLFQIGLDRFVAERNALAKALKRPDVKALEKPSVPAWAANQVYWRSRDVFERLVSAAEAVRDAHRRALAGGAADLRTAEGAHRSAVRDAVAAAQEALSSAGMAVTPATIEAIRRTFESMPHPEANGRLVRPLSPAGLEALAGLAVVPRPRDSHEPPSGGMFAAAQAQAVFGSRGPATADEARQRAARAAEERRERRLAAERALETARAELDRADAAVADAERVLDDRRAERDSARLAVKHATRALDEV